MTQGHMGMFSEDKLGRYLDKGLSKMEQDL